MPHPPAPHTQQCKEGGGRGGQSHPGGNSLKRFFQAQGLGHDFPLNCDPGATCPPLNCQAAPSPVTPHLSWVKSETELLPWSSPLGAPGPCTRIYLCGASWLSQSWLYPCPTHHWSEPPTASCPLGHFLLPGQGCQHRANSDPIAGLDPAPSPHPRGRQAAWEASPLCVSSYEK